MSDFDWNEHVVGAAYCEALDKAARAADERAQKISLTLTSAKLTDAAFKHLQKLEAAELHAASELRRLADRGHKR